MPSAGRFTLDVSDPYPCWVRVSVEGREVMCIHHVDLPDLLFAVQRAQQEALRKLPTHDKAEAASPGTPLT